MIENVYGIMHHDKMQESTINDSNYVSAVVVATGTPIDYYDEYVYRDIEQFGLGDKKWHNDDKLHREGDLPAIVATRGKYTFYRDPTKKRIVYSTNIEDYNKRISEDYLLIYYKNGLITRDNDQPAVISWDGTKIWYKDGIVHREGDKPAAIRVDGAAMYYKHGKLTRDNGPSIMYVKQPYIRYVNNPGPGRRSKLAIKQSDLSGCLLI